MGTWVTYLGPGSWVGTQGTWVGTWGTRGTWVGIPGVPGWVHYCILQVWLRLCSDEEPSIMRRPVPRQSKLISFDLLPARQARQISCSQLLSTLYSTPHKAFCCVPARPNSRNLFKASIETYLSFLLLVVGQVCPVVSKLSPEDP